MERSGCGINLQGPEYYDSSISSTISSSEDEGVKVSMDDIDDSVFWKYDDCPSTNYLPTNASLSQMTMSNSALECDQIFDSMMPLETLEGMSFPEGMEAGDFLDPDQLSLKKNGSQDSIEVLEYSDFSRGSELDDPLTSQLLKVTQRVDELTRAVDKATLQLNQEEEEEEEEEEGQKEEGQPESLMEMLIKKEIRKRKSSSSLRQNRSSGKDDEANITKGQSGFKGFTKENVHALKILFMLSVLTVLAFSLQLLNTSFRQGQDGMDLESKLRKMESILATLTNLDKTMDDSGVSLEMIGLFVKEFEENRVKAAALWDQLKIDDNLKAKLKEDLNAITDSIRKFDRIIEMKVQERVKKMAAKLEDYRGLVHELIDETTHLKNDVGDFRKEITEELYKQDKELCSKVSSRCALSIVYRVPKNAFIQFCSIVYNKIAGFFQLIASPFQRDILLRKS